MSILNENFWDAFFHGKYLQTHKGILSVNIEKYGEFLEGIGYSRSLYSSDFHQDWNFFIDILAVKSLCFISLNLVKNHKKFLGVIEYNPQFKKSGTLMRKMKYYITRMKNNPEAFRTIQLIKKEFFEKVGIVLEEKTISKGFMPYKGILNQVLVNAKWKDIELNESSLEPEDVIRRISDFAVINLEPTTVGNYLCYSPDAFVRSKAMKGTIKIKADNKQILKNWEKISKENPELTPYDIVQKIAKDLNLDPRTVVFYGVGLKNEMIRKHCRRISQLLSAEKYEIEDKWLEIQKIYPSITPLEIATTIANVTGLSLRSVCSYGMSSDNKDIRDHCRNLNLILIEREYDIFASWEELAKDKKLSEKLIVEKLSKKTGLSPQSILMTLKISEDDNLRKRSFKLSKEFQEEKHKIEERWLEIKRTDPELNDIEIILKLSKEKNISPVTICGFSSVFKNKDIRKVAFNAQKRFLSEKHNLEDRWKELINEKLDLDYSQLITLISQEKGLSPLTLLQYMRYSSDQSLKSIAIKYSPVFLEAKHEITKKWLKIVCDHPELSPIEIVNRIAKLTTLNPVTVCGYGRHSENKVIKKACNRIENHYLLTALDRQSSQ